MFPTAVNQRSANGDGFAPDSCRVGIAVLVAEVGYARRLARARPFVMSRPATVPARSLPVTPLLKHKATAAGRCWQRRPIGGQRSGGRSRRPLPRLAAGPHETNVDRSVHLHVNTLQISVHRRT